MFRAATRRSIQMKKQIFATLIMALVAGSMINNVSAQTSASVAADADVVARAEKFKANRVHIATLEQENARLTANAEVYKEALGTEPVVTSSPAASTTASPSATTDTKAESATKDATEAEIKRLVEDKRREIAARKNLPGPTANNTSAAPASTPADPMDREGYTKTLVGSYIQKVEDPRSKPVEILARKITLVGETEGKMRELCFWTDGHHNITTGYVSGGVKAHLNRPDHQTWKRGEIRDGQTGNILVVYYVDSPEGKVVTASRREYHQKPSKNQRR